MSSFLVQLANGVIQMEVLLTGQPRSCILPLLYFTFFARLVGELVTCMQLYPQGLHNVQRIVARVYLRVQRAH